jgi:hypothetical protein
MCESTVKPIGGEDKNRFKEAEQSEMIGDVWGHHRAIGFIANFQKEKWSEKEGQNG